jgi:hypothetical protein
MSITVHYENENGEEIEMALPSKKEVCHECDGGGYVLCEGMRGHAYSAEEFMESFDDEEDRGEYFTRGGKYDQQCDVCHGQNVVDVIDEEHLNSAQKEFYEAFQQYENERLQSEADDRHTMRAECGYQD